MAQAAMKKSGICSTLRREIQAGVRRAAAAIEQCGRVPNPESNLAVRLVNFAGPVQSVCV